MVIEWSICLSNGGMLAVTGTIDRGNEGKHQFLMYKKATDENRRPYLWNMWNRNYNQDYIDDDQQRIGGVIDWIKIVYTTWHNNWNPEHDRSTKTNEKWRTNQGKKVKTKFKANEQTNKHNRPTAPKLLNSFLFFLSFFFPFFLSFFLSFFLFFKFSNLFIYIFFWFSFF